MSVGRVVSPLDMGYILANGGASGRSIVGNHVLDI